VAALGDFEIGDLALGGANGAQQEHSVHVRMHGVLQSADAITDGGVFLHAEEHFAVQQAPAGDRDEERRGR